jgi:protein-disulfide isomerase
MSGVSAWVPRLALGVGALALIAAVISLAVGEGGPQPRDIGGVNEVQRLFGGIEQDGAYLGSADAEVTVTVFNDLQCTTCAVYQVNTIDPLVEEYVRPGEARFELRHFSIGGREATLAALAATSAGEQERQWQYADLFVRNQALAAPGGVTEELLREIAEAVSELEVDAWESDLEAPEVLERVEADGRLATELRLPAEPAVVISGPAGERKLVESPSGSQIEAAIAEAR